MDEALHLCVVADGIGGHNAGEVASRLAVDAVSAFIADPQSRPWEFGYESAVSPAGNLLRTAIHLANERILEAAGASRDLAGMATTIVAALVVGDRLSVCHVGDMTLHGVTAEVTWNVAATVTGETIAGRALTSFPFSTFNLTKPSVPLLASADDKIQLEVEFRCKRTPI